MVEGKALHDAEFKAVTNRIDTTGKTIESIHLVIEAL